MSTYLAGMWNRRQLLTIEFFIFKGISLEKILKYFDIFAEWQKVIGPDNAPTKLFFNLLYQKILRI